MDRAPRERDEVILSGPRLARIVASAVVITAGTLAVFVGFRDAEPQAALTMAFTAFVFFQLVNAFCVRVGDATVFSRHTLSNRPLLWALAAVVAMQVVIVHVPFFERVFDTVPLTLSQWGLVVAVPMSLLVVEELRKAVIRFRRR